MQGWQPFSCAELSYTRTDSVDVDLAGWALAVHIYATGNGLVGIYIVETIS